MEPESFKSCYIEPLLGSYLCRNVVSKGLSELEQAKLESSKIIDGIVFVADTLEFFTLPPPLSLDRVWVARRAEERFKGLKRWRKELPHVIEIKLFGVRGYPLSVLFAYDGNKGISFHQIIERINAAKEDAMNCLPDSSLSRAEFNNSIDKIARFIDEDDFRTFQQVFKTHLDARLLTLRSSAKTSFILYKFGQCTKWDRFYEEFSWIVQNNLSHLIIHYARDYKLENHILWFMPAAVKKRLGKSPDSIYYVGLQPGLGNVRHKFKQNHAADSDITHVTWYTRIWNEVHRDRSKFFSPERRLITDLQKIVEECFLSKQMRRVIPNDIRQKLPKMIRNSAHLMESYPARCEAVVIFSGPLLQCNSLRALIQKCATLADESMAKREFYSTKLLLAQSTKKYQEKLSKWFPKFAGTVERVVATVSRIIVARGRVEDGYKVEQKLDCFQQLIDLFSVDLILTLCYTGNYVIKKYVYSALGLDTNYFLTGVHYEVPNFRSLQSHFMEGRDCVEREICSAIVNVLVGMSYQFSNIQYTDQIRLNNLAKSIKEGSFLKANVFTSTEFVALLQGNAVPRRSGLDDRFNFLRRVLIKVLGLVFHETFWDLLDETIIDKTVEEGVPLVFQKSLEQNSCPDIVVVPAFRERLPSHISRFNRSWPGTAHLYRGEVVPESAKQVQVYECFNSLSQKEIKKLVSGIFVDVIAFSLQWRSDGSGQNSPENFEELNDVEKAYLLSQKSIVRGKQGRFGKKKKLSKAELEQQEVDYLSAVNFMEMTKTLQMGPATTIFMLKSGIPLVLSELACSYMQPAWMSALTVNAGMEMIRISFSPEFWNNNIILSYDTVILRTEQSWPERNERLTVINPETRRIFHIVTLVNHFVLLIFQIETVATMTYLEMFTYNPMENDLFYQNQARIAEIKLQRMIEEQLRQCYRDNQIQFLESRHYDQESCGPACLNFLECTLRSNTLDPKEFDPTLKDMPFEVYKWEIIFRLLNQSEDGRQICEHFDNRKNDIVDYLRSVAD
ncbi:unnamed protein product [Allacma fusca]|uniref:Uncharacterized protein n=1 Tax=Allacma fusca TaxID=39272 RepID=A0A8J2LBB5_9HEXA|nr:unnamed protein product [Allacma fusca]